MSERIPFESCPLCGGSYAHLRSENCTSHHAYAPGMALTVDWVRCKDCGHVFTDGFFTPQANQELFAKGDPHQKPFADFEQARFISSRMIERIIKNLDDPGGDWLDVGFGNASLLITAREYGFHPIGLDLRPASVEALKNFGISAYCCDITAAEIKNAMVISMADVLEHMPFPLEALAAARRMIRPDGVLFVSVPRYGCDAWNLLDASWQNPYWHEIEHYHNFSSEILRWMLGKTGFRPISYAVGERYRVGMEVCAVPIS